MGKNKDKPEIMIQGDHYEEEECEIKDYPELPPVGSNPNKYRDENAFTEIYNALMKSNKRNRKT